VAQVVGLPLQLLAIHSHLPRREGHYTYTEREGRGGRRFNQPSRRRRAVVY
jgi:hypothetical protein